MPLPQQLKGLNNLNSVISSLQQDGWLCITRVAKPQQAGQVIPVGICEAPSGYWAQLWASQYKKYRQLEHVQLRAKMMIWGLEHGMNEESLMASAWGREGKRGSKCCLQLNKNRVEKKRQNLGGYAHQD